MYFAPLGLLTLAACQAAAPDTAKIAESIKGETTKAVAAMNARDAEKAVAIDADDYVGMLHGTANVVGRAADLVATKAQVADPAMKFEMGETTIDVAKGGDMAVERVAYTYTYTDPKTKAPAVEHGNWVLGWKLQADGSWKMAWSVASDTPAPKG
jgi:ketosteroid isomerase-like protein